MWRIVLVVRLFRPGCGLPGPAAPTRPVVGVTEVGSVAGRLVAVARGQLAVTCGGLLLAPAFLGFGVRATLAPLGAPVPLLRPVITLVGTLDQEGDAGIVLDVLELSENGVLVTLALVGLRVAPVGSTVSLIGFPVAPVGFPVAPVGLAVTSVGVPVTPIGRQVPLSAGIAFVGGIGPQGRGPVPLLGGSLSLSCGLVAKVRAVPASLRQFFALPTRLSAVDQTFRVLVGSPRSLSSLSGEPVPLVGDVGALVRHAVALIGDAVALVGNAVPLIGAKLARSLLGIGGHRNLPW